MRAPMAILIGFVISLMLCGPRAAEARQQGVLHVSDNAACDTPAYPLPRNFDAVYPRRDLQTDAIAAHVAPNFITRPWYLTPNRNYAFYRPWYTYGLYGPTNYRYHYAPSAGYQQPWYGPQYLNPDAIAPPAGEQLYHW